MNEELNAFRVACACVKLHVHAGPKSKACLSLIQISFCDFSCLLIWTIMIEAT